MLDNLYTIKGKNGEVLQGNISWLHNGEFWFFDGVKRFWGKLDYWTIISQGISIGRIIVK